MTIFKRVSGLLLAVFFALIGIWVVEDNALEVSVVLLGFPLGSFPVGVWFLFAVFLGATLSFAANLPRALQLKRKVKRLQRQVDGLKPEKLETGKQKTEKTQ